MKTLGNAARVALSLAALVSSACSDGDGNLGAELPSTGTGSGSGASSGTNTGSGGAGTGGSLSTVSSGAGGGQDDCGSDLTGTLRDFQQSHPDFEYVVATDPGIVEQDLGSDGKPVYAGSPTTPSTTGKDNFDQWYRDVSGVNLGVSLTLTLADNGDGTFTYDNSSFFPLDGQGWGDEGNPHNYHFTFELRTKFRYNGGEVFTFTGDDDLFVFVNGKLAIDLGGVHGAISGSVDLDAQASHLGITPGQIYPLDFFFAERHLSESNFRIDTSIDEFVDCGDIE
jgi:fibro-slime domain-containing protein